MVMMMMDSASEFFPAGLRVLVVDDDPTWLKILRKMLNKCSYQVTTCGLAREALRLLRDRKDGFDIVISDVNMPDMDGFKLLEHVGLEMDLPVIMMSVDGETSRVMKGVQHGACDYLLKPIRMKELRNIWQHVLRKRMHEFRDTETHDNFDDDDFSLFRYAADLSEAGHFLNQSLLRKRKDFDTRHGGDRDSGGDPSAKKPRIVWSIDLHQKFVRAVNQIGFDKVGPKRILDMMNVPWLTRENVASHLQKYRLYLSRLEKENEMKSADGGGFKSIDQPPKDSGGGFGIQYAYGMQQPEAGSVSFTCPDYKPSAKSIDAKSHEIGPNGIDLWPLAVPEIPFTSDIPDVHKATPRMGLDSSLGSPKPNICYAAFDSHFTWTGEAHHSPFGFEYKPHHRQQVLEMPFVDEDKPLSLLEDCFSSQMTVHVPQQHIPADLQQQAVGDNNVGIIGIKLLSDEFSSNVNVMEQPLLISQSSGSVTQSNSCDLNHDIFGSTSEASLDFNQSASESSFGSLADDDLGLYLVQGTTSIGSENLGLLDYHFPDFMNGATPTCLYEVPRYNFEYFSDSMEYAV